MHGIANGRSNYLQMCGTEAFLSRDLENAVELVLTDTLVVCVLGARQVGKSTLVRRLGANWDYINLEEASFSRVARSGPAGFVQGLPEFAIIDEVQRSPVNMPAIKISVDKSRKAGRCLLTGSAKLLGSSTP